MRSALLLLFFLSVSAFGQRSDFGSIDFKKADSIASLHKGESLKNLPVLTHKLTAELKTDVEKFRAIYTWVSTNIENDYSAYVKTKKKRKKLSDDREAFLEWNTSFTPKVFEKLLQDRKTACTGYAYLIRELTNLIDINCEIVDGFGRTALIHLDSTSIPNHSWNAVELDSKWYLCDATWSAGRIIIEEKGPKFQSDYDDGYFLADPALFVKNHYPIKEKWTLLSEPPTFQEFTEGPIVYKEAFGPNIIPVTPTKMHLETVKNQNVRFNFTVPNDFKSENVVLIINNGRIDKTPKSKVSPNKNTYSLDHIFEKTGVYDVHLQVDDEIVATYVVRVRKKLRS